MLSLTQFDTGLKKLLDPSSERYPEILGPEEKGSNPLDLGKI